MLSLKDWKTIENFGKELTKCVRLDEKVELFFFNELGFAKCCVKQGNAFHFMINTNEPLPTNAYWALFCGNHTIDMQVQHGKNNWKMKFQWEGREVAHILLVEPMWFHMPFLNFIPMEWDHSKNCCKKLQHSQWTNNEKSVKS